MPDLTVVVDAMGGDHAPAATVDGAVSAALRAGVRIVLVGQAQAVEAELARRPQATGGRVSVVDASTRHPIEGARVSIAAWSLTADSIRSAWALHSRPRRVHSSAVSLSDPALRTARSRQSFSESRNFSSRSRRRLPSA